jgi:hypothetical protein
MVKVEGYDVPEGLYYSKDFAWLKVEMIKFVLESQIMPKKPCAK